MTLSVVLACVAVATIGGLGGVSGQYRPSYFPRPGGFDTQLPQFGAGSGGSGGDQVLGNRNQQPELPAPGMANSLDDVQLANRVNEWPHPQQPFWFVNRQQIKDHIARPVPCQGAGCPPAAPAHQSPFITSAQRMRRRR